VTPNTLSHPLTSSETQAVIDSFPQGIISIDLETTGLSPLMDKIIELSALKLTPDGQIKSFSTLINPQIHIPEDSTEIHGITNDMIANSPLLNDLMPGFIEFIEELPLLAHNAKFDLGFLMFNIQKSKLGHKNNSVYCSCQYSRRALPQMPNHKLKTLVDELGITLENHHRAEDDALAALQVLAQGLKKTKGEVKPLKLFMLQEFNPKNGFDIPEHLQGLKKKVRFGHVVMIKYKGGTHKNEWRPVQLTSLLPLPHGSVLYAKCLLSQVYKSFLLSRIAEWRNATEEERKYHLSQ
jgi:DNA polymerase III epsilon subunit family exonuclease